MLLYAITLNLFLFSSSDQVPDSNLKVFFEEVDWATGNNLCRQDGMELVNLQSAEKNLQVLVMAQNNLLKSYWLRRRFYFDENSDEFCSMAWSSRDAVFEDWHDVSCNEKHSVICEPDPLKEIDKMKKHLEAKEKEKARLELEIEQPKRKETVPAEIVDRMAPTMDFKENLTELNEKLKKKQQEFHACDRHRLLLMIFLGISLIIHGVLAVAFLTHCIRNSCKRDKPEEVAMNSL